VRHTSGADLSDQRAQARRPWTLDNYSEKSIIFAKILRLPVCSLCQCLLRWQRAVRSPQCALRTVTLGNLPGTKYGHRHRMTQNLDDRTLGSVDLRKPRSSGPSRRGAQICGQTRNLGDRTLHPVDLSKRARRAAEAAGAPEYWGQARCPIYRSVTFNMKRSALNFQRGDRKGGWWAGYGDRHGIWTTGLLTRWTWAGTGRVVEAGCGTQIWGRTRCPICQSGTSNVQRSTLNF